MFWISQNLFCRPFGNHIYALSSRGAALFSLFSLQLDGIVRRLGVRWLLAQK